MKYQKKSGFGHVAVFILVFVLGIVGLVGWRVFDARQTGTSQPTLKQRENTSQSTTKAAEDIAAADSEALAWKEFTSGQKGFSIRIPDGWEFSTYTQSDNFRGNDVTYSKGSPVKVDTIDGEYAGDSPVRFQIAQTPSDGSFYGGDMREWQVQPFKLQSIGGKKYSRKIASDWEGC